MKKKSIVLIAAALVLVAAIAYTGMRIINRRTDINGVTTLYEKDTAVRVIMNAKPGKEFYAGSGKLAVGDGKSIHVEYAIESGSFDLAFHKGSGGLDAILGADLDNLPESGDVFGKSGISGKGSLDFEAVSGEYTVYFKPHGAVGTATVTAI